MDLSRVSNQSIYRLASAGTKPPVPFAELTGHKLEVTDVKISEGSSIGRIFSSSRDSTCRVWNALTSTCIYTITCPSPISSIAIVRPYKLQLELAR